MKFKRKLMSFVVSGIIAVMSCCSLTSYATYNTDVNNDGATNTVDIVLIMQYLCGHHEPTDLNSYDVDGNGVISAMDSYIIQLRVLGAL